jgi:cell division septum initiation protein DivIVA
MPDWSAVLSLIAFGLGAVRVTQLWVPTLDFVHRCIETAHRNRQERRYQDQYHRITEKRLAESSGEDLDALAENHTEMRVTYLGSPKNGSESEESTGDDEGDESGKNPPTTLKPIDRPA